MSPHASGRPPNPLYFCDKNFFAAGDGVDRGDNRAAESDIVELTIDGGGEQEWRGADRPFYLD